MTDKRPQLTRIVAALVAAGDAVEQAQTIEIHNHAGEIRLKLVQYQTIKQRQLQEATQ